MGAKERERIDVLLVELGHFESREKAKAAIMAGIVFVGEERIEKAGMKVDRALPIKVKGAPHPYVSRGGLKLEKAIQFFALNIQNSVLIDIGASTGGFTDCALQHGASFVYAIDVGTNQLDWSIRSHPQVLAMERTNFRYLKLDDLRGPQPDFATIDVSFISLRLIFPALYPILAEAGQVVALVKPQFEAGREQVGKAGIVREATIHRSVLRRTIDDAAEQGFKLQGLTYSPITGGEGNIEFLGYWIKSTEEKIQISDEEELEKLIANTVEEATQQLR